MYNYPISLVASFIAMVCVSTAYFMRKKTYYLLCQLLCILFLSVSYFFTLQFFAMIGLAVGFFRAITFFIYENKGKQASIYWSLLFSALTIASYWIVNFQILKTAQSLDILCLSALILYAFIFRIRNLKIVRLAMIVPTMLSILFNILTHAAFFVVLTYLFELVANLVAIVKYHNVKEN